MRVFKGLDFSKSEPFHSVFSRSLLLHRLQRGVLQGCLHCSAWPLTAASSGSLGRSIFSAHSVSVQVYRGAENVDWVGKLCEKINELE
ncbi:hypothetical protein V6N13_055160 [Hibiscus sabdariffa]